MKHQKGAGQHVVELLLLLLAAAANAEEVERRQTKVGAHRRLGSCDPGDHVAASGGDGGCCYWTDWECDQPSCDAGYTAVYEESKNDGCGFFGRSERTECCTGPGFDACKALCNRNDWCWRGCSFRSKGGTANGDSLANCKSECVSNSSPQVATNAAET